MSSVYEGFFEMLDPEATRAYEAPIDVTGDVEAEDTRLDEAAEAEVGAYDEEETEPVEDEEVVEEEPTEETIDEESPEEEVSDEEPVDDVTDENVTDEEDQEETIEEETPEDPNTEYEKCKRVHTNTQRLLAIVNLSRDSFEQKYSKSVREHNRKDYHMICKSFTDLDETINMVLTEKFTNGTYQTLIKYYVSLCKVYDIITRMVDNYVKTYIEEKSETKS